MAATIVAQFEPERIILFGSYARGDAGEHSDIDLLVVKDSGLPRYKRSVPIYRALRWVRSALDVLVYTPAEVRDWSDVPEALVSRAVREGRVLYEKPA